MEKNEAIMERKQHATSNYNMKKTKNNNNCAYKIRYLVRTHTHKFYLRDFCFVKNIQQQKSL